MMCRVLTFQDSLAYRHLRLEALRIFPTCFGANYAQQATLNKLYVQTLLEQDSDEVVMLGAFIDNQLIGLCGLKETPDNRREIIQMYVTRTASGQGVAQQLLRLAKQILPQIGATALILTVYIDNHSAIKTYLTAGFEVSCQQHKQLLMHYKPMN